LECLSPRRARVGGAQAEDRYLGAALARLLRDLGIEEARPGRVRAR